MPLSTWRTGLWHLLSQPIVPPPPGVQTLYGASWGGATGEGGPNQAAFERIDNAFGGMEVVRWFPGSDTLPNWVVGTAPGNIPAYVKDSGAAIIFSWRRLPNQITDNSFDAQLIAHFQNAPTDRQLWGCLYHEVDATGLINGSTPQFTLAEYHAAQQHIKALKDIHAPPNYHLALILMSESVVPSRGPAHPAEYYWDDSFETLGIDMYQHGQSFATMDPASLYVQPAVDLAQQLGVPLIVPELGIRNLNFQTDQQRATGLSAAIGVLDGKASAVTYYESFRGNLGPWNLTEEPLGTTYSPLAWAVWSSAVSGTSPPTDPPGETVVNKVLTNNVATLTTAGPHGRTVGPGKGITVTGVGSNFNGTYLLTAVTSTTLSYAKTAPDVASQAATGTVVAATIPIDPPPPPPPGGMFIGASQFDFDDYNTLLKNPTGSKAGGTNTGLSVRRSYDNFPKTSFANSAAGGDPARGVASAYSMQMTPAQVSAFAGSTTMRDQLRQYFNSIPAGHRMWFTMAHEPENNGFDLAAFRTMQAAAFDVLVSSSADRNLVKIGTILTNEPYRANSPVQPAAYYPGGGTLATVNSAKFDFVGVDFYNYWRPPTAPIDTGLPNPRGALHPPSYWADPTFAFARNVGNKPIMVGEHGIHPDPDVPTMRPERFQATMDYWEASGKVEAFCLFHSNQGAHGPWWFHCYHVYDTTSGGVAPWNSGNRNDVSHIDNPTINKVRDMLAAHPRWTNGD